MKAQDFFQGLFTVDLAADEIIVGVQFTPVKSGAYAKLYQRASHFAIVASRRLSRSTTGRLLQPTIGMTGASSHATRADSRRKCTCGQARAASSIEAAVRNAGAEIEDINSDSRQR